MSAGQKAYGMLKSFMLASERFDGIEARMKTITEDQAALGRSHADLAQRVARLEGFLEGAAAATRTPPQIEG